MSFNLCLKSDNQYENSYVELTSCKGEHTLHGGARGQGNVFFYYVIYVLSSINPCSGNLAQKYGQKFYPRTFKENAPVLS